jgi:CSLREA domain-containing protein
VKSTSRIRAAVLVLMVSASVALPMGQHAQAATFAVTTFNDELNSDADCSLREAVVSINEESPQSGCPDPGSGVNTIVLKKGTYKIERENDGGDENLFGDFDLFGAGDIRIRGAGARRTVVDGDEMDRVFQASDVVEITDLTIKNGNLTGPGASGGSAEDSGGGVFNSGGLTLKRVRVVRNETIPSDADAEGGGIFSGDALTIIDSEIAFNQSTLSGGIQANHTTTIRDSTIHNNRSETSDSGGGMTLADQTTLRNVTISENSTDEGTMGGGFIMKTASADLTMTHVTVASNEPGNIAVTDAETDIGSSGSVIADPIGANNCDIVAGATFKIAAQDSDIDEDGTCNSAALHVDPKLKQLDDYGGPVPTMALKAASPAVDASIKSCLAADARGAPRPQADCDGDNEQDIGAYELVRCGGTIVNRVGTEGRDVLTGTPLSDGFLARGGRDTVRAKAGRDAACGGGGKDRLKGADDRDTLLGQGGDDALNGGAGSDLCVGGPGNDSATACEETRSL